MSKKQPRATAKQHLEDIDEAQQIIQRKMQEMELGPAGRSSK